MEGTPVVIQSLAGLPAFLSYFCVSAVAVILYLLIYTRITPYSEFDLISKNNRAAALSLGLSLLGFALPVASAVAHAANIVDCAIWSIIALAVQVIAYYVARIPVSDLPKKIVDGDLAAGLWLGLASLTAGLLSAASMTL
jgi:putative membrane protein